MKGYEAAQRAYDAMLPPDHDDEEPDLIPAPPGEGTCAGCGEDYDADSMICECLMGPRIVDPDYQTPAERREAAAEARAEASYDRG